MKAIIIVPTYNEKDNIEKIINAVLELPSYVEILVVDDNSPDKTADLVEKYLNNKRVHLLKREKKRRIRSRIYSGL